MKRDERAAVIRRMKGLSGDGRSMVFPIRHYDLSVIGYLRTIDRSILDDSKLIEVMAKARAHHAANFLTQFDVTADNKRWWLENGVLNNDDKALFLVESDDHTVVGQDGFTILSDDVFSLDGTMRWIRRGHKDLYVRSGVERASICFFMLGCKLSTTEVFKDNIPNVKNSIRMGHDIAAEHRLFLSESDNTLRYEKVEDIERSNTDRIILSFEMTRDDFLKKHPERTRFYIGGEENDS
ncbi:MAG: hypothetical protein LBT08_01980 [Synergistaceae bacterium]|jgi:hypothetical protein|nr:hypothetical protein [Synergistaceae bacterium]